jgi:hypothetical protein
VGYVSWLFLAAGIVLVLRASDRGRCGWEIVALIAVACAPPTIMCLNEYFHPQDLITVGLALAAIAGVFRERWITAGVLFGVAFTSQQFALLFFIPVIFVAPRGSRTRLLSGFLAAIAIIEAPLMLITSGRALKAFFVGTGANTKSATLLVQLHLHGNVLYALSRALPLIVGGALAMWLRQHRGAAAREPITLLSLLAASLTLRLVFEINLWGYYFMAVTVVLIMRQAIRGRINWLFVLWLAVVTYAAIDGGLANRPALAPLPILFWQAVLVPWALALSLGSLRAPVLDQVAVEKNV